MVEMITTRFSHRIILIVRGIPDNSGISEFEGGIFIPRLIIAFHCIKDVGGAQALPKLAPHPYIREVTPQPHGNRPVHHAGPAFKLLLQPCDN